MFSAKAYSASFEQAAREDYLETLAKQRLRCLKQSCVADFETVCRSNTTAALEPLLASHFLEAPELQALTAASTGVCRVLGQATVLTSVLGLVVRGFQEITDLQEGCASCLSELEKESEVVRQQLRNLSKEQIKHTREEAGSGLQGWADQCRTVLEIVSVLLQGGEPAHDGVAVRKLLLDGSAGERAADFEMERISAQQCRRFQKMMVQHRGTVAFVQARGGSAGAFAAWLEMLYSALEDQRRIREMHCAKRAVSKFVIPLARWALRPLLGPSLGRVAFPPAKSKDFRSQAMAALIKATPTPLSPRTRLGARHRQATPTEEHSQHSVSASSSEGGSAASSARRMWAPAPSQSTLLQEQPPLHAQLPACQWESEFGHPPPFEQLHHQLQRNSTANRAGAAGAAGKDVRCRMRDILEVAATDGSLEHLLGGPVDHELMQPKIILSAPPLLSKTKSDVKAIPAARGGSFSSCSTAVAEDDVRDCRGLGIAGVGGSSGAGDITPGLLELSSDEEESLAVSLGLSR